MGAFIVNFNVRSNDRHSVEKTLRDMKVAAAWVTAPKNGWITVYEERASGQDEERIQELSQRLSASAAVVALLVHDSDVLCYWLYERGKLLDEYNSCPDYFEDGDPAAAAESRGKPEVLLNYCAAGKKLADVQQTLGNTDRVFAEEQLTEMAELLGIDPTRARMDFAYVGNELAPTEIDAVFVGTKPAPDRASGALRRPRILSGEDDDDSGDEESPSTGPWLRMTAVSAMLQALGMGQSRPPVDPQLQALVQAAAENNIGEIDRLTAAGTDINGQAPMKATVGDSPLAARLLSGGGLAIPATPLLAALAQKHVEATQRLLELGANVKLQNPLLGTPVHAAACSGRVDLLRMVLDAGGDPNVANAHRQTPLDSIRYLRTMMNQAMNIGALGAALGAQLSERMKGMMPSAESLDECEALLRERGGR